MNSKRMIKRLETTLKGVLLSLVILSVFFGTLIFWWSVRQNDSQVNPKLIFEHWDAVSNGRHNANTDLVFWNEHYYFIYANQPGNQGSTTTFLSLERSTNFHDWVNIASFSVPGEDIRDPKFCIIHDKLFIYYLKNKGFIADPYTTEFVYTTDGENFSEPRMIPGLEGWLFWRPKTIDNITWWVTGYWYKKGQCILLNSTDGFNWNKISSVFNASGNDEDALVFLPDGRILITGRVEIEVDSIFGDVNAGTMLCVAEPPYTNWKCKLDKTTRLDGPNLFTLLDNKTNTTRVFALGRYQPDRDALFTALGSVFSKKYTSLFEFVNLSETPQLKYISDLPSSGDTSYGGVLVQGDRLYASYYSSDIKKDPAWILGMILPSDIYMINMSIRSIFSAAANPLARANYLPWDNYFIFSANVACAFILIIKISRNKRKNRKKLNIK
ncbi:MAG: hypothetical protein ACTSVI_03610 [Promethearchaeota archaeon]